MQIFKDIPGYEGLYQIGDQGDVKSLEQLGDYKGRSYLKERILKPSKQKRSATSYTTVVLSKDKVTKTFSVHRLVAKAFVDNPDNKPIVNHIDNNGLNNSKDNLEWVTQKENMKHSEDQGRQEASHLAGGIAIGKIKTEAAKKRWDDRVGHQFGGVIILSIDSYGKHPKGTVKCTHCDKTYTATLSSTVRGKTYGCRSCGISNGKSKVKI